MSSQDEIEIPHLLEAIYQEYHQDFRHYSMASLTRRVALARDQMGCQTTADLERLVSGNVDAFTRLFQFLTVQVSDMFRDPSFFRAFRQEIVPILSTYPSLKLWVAGCSTGEELYSYAIILREEGLLDRSILYATDISPEALRKAQAGVYSIDRVAAFSENHRLSGAKCSLSEYYTASHGLAVFDRSLRKNVVFSDHSLATDSVFAEMQVISCRNVLIYFDRTLQYHAVALMRDSLCRRGFLGLGTRESLAFTKSSSAFKEFSPAERWYQKW